MAGVLFFANYCTLRKIAGFFIIHSQTGMGCVYFVINEQKTTPQPFALKPYNLLNGV
jgi:hypothetical protein